MKYLFLILLVVLSFCAAATDKGKTPTPPPPKLEQVQQQQQQSQQATATIGDIDNSNWLKNKVNQYNNQLNNSIDYLDCQPAIGAQEIDSVSYSVVTLSGCIGYEDFNNTGAATIGIVIPFVSKETKQAFRTKAREVERDQKQKADINELQNAFRDAIREIQRLNREVSELKKQGVSK